MRFNIKHWLFFTAFAEVFAGVLFFNCFKSGTTYFEYMVGSVLRYAMAWNAYQGARHELEGKYGFIP